MKASNLLLTFCLVSGVSLAHAATPAVAATAKTTADSQMQSSASDVELTRKIRDRLTDDDSLSTSAKNVTIVTLGNTVTIKGNVEKQGEVNKITTVAQDLAKGKTIKNELRVNQ